MTSEEVKARAVWILIGDDTTSEERAAHELAQWALEAVKVLEKMANNADVCDYDIEYMGLDEIMQLASEFLTGKVSG